jgi:glycerol-3-phosphate acyltransferase PlsY
MTIVMAVAVGFLLGSIPFGYLVSLVKHIDIREQGSGNIGATNVGRVLGPKFFALVFVLDVLKGVAAVLLSGVLNASPYLSGLAAIAGHIFTPFLGFRGGKGVATSIGVLLSLFPAVFAVALGVWLIIYFITYYVSLASVAFALALSCAYFLIGDSTLLNRLIVVAITLLIIATHIPNIQRLVARTEPKTIIWRHR